MNKIKNTLRVLTAPIWGSLLLIMVIYYYLFVWPLEKVFAYLFGEWEGWINEKLFGNPKGK